MIDSVGMYTSALLTPDDLFAFVEKNGGHVVSREKYFESTIQTNGCALFIFYSSDSLPYLELDEDGELIRQLLRGEIRTEIEIGMTRAEGTLELLQAFVQSFATKWTTVLGYSKRDEYLFLSGKEILEPDGLIRRLKS